MNSKRNLKLSLIAPLAVMVLLGGLLVFILSGDDSAPSDSLNVGQNQGSVDGIFGDGGDVAGATDLASELLEYRMAEGKAYEYSFTRTMDARVNGEAMVDLQLGGLFTPHVVRSENGRLDLIVAVRLDKTGGINAAELPAAQSGGAPAYLAHLQMDRTGHPLFLRFSKETSDPAEQGLVRDVIAAWLQPLPGPGARAQMTVDEDQSWLSSIFGGKKEVPGFSVTGTDTQGYFEAALRLVGASDEESTNAENILRYDLQKEQYRDSLTPIRVEESEHKITWRIEHGTFGGSAGKDRLVMGPSEFQVDSAMQYVYNLDDVGAALYTTADLARFTIHTDVYDVAGYLSDREVEIPERTKAKPWHELKPQLQSVKAEMDGQKRTEIFNSLAVSVRANPALARDAAAAAREYSSDDHRFQMVMGALSYSGSAEAQQQLVELFQEGDLDYLGRESVIDAFTLMSEPASPEALDLLQKAFAGDDPDLAGRAGLALGTAQRNNPSQRLRDWIRDEWRAARNDVQRQTVLEYVGNSGDPQLLDIIDEALNVGDFNVKLLALDSTRFMDASDVNTYLLRIYENRERHERLRYGALSALANHRWEERFLPVMQSCVQNESMEAMRMRCARFTLEQLRHENKMKSLLREVRATYASESWHEFVDRETAP